jgi:hypothetical protein
MAIVLNVLFIIGHLMLGSSDSIDGTTSLGGDVFMRPEKNASSGGWRVIGELIGIK